MCLTATGRPATFLAALRWGGLTAPVVFEGAANGDIFLTYVQDHLAPTLNAGDIVVMDKPFGAQGRGCARGD